MAIASVVFDIRAGVAKLNQDFARAEKRIDSGMKSIQGMFRKAAGALGVYFGAQAIKNMTLGVTNAANEMADMAQRTGVTTEALMGLKHAAEQNGGTIDNLARGLRNIAERSSEVAAGNQQMAERYARFGIAVTDASGAVRSSDEILMDIAETLSKMPDGAAKTEAAMKLVGVNAGPRLLPMLNNGRAGLEEYRREAERLGIAFSRDFADASNRFNSNLDRLNKASQGLKASLVSGILPALEAVTDRMVESAMSSERYAKVKESAAAAGELFVAVVDMASQVMGELLAPIREALPSMEELAAAVRGFQQDVEDGNDAMHAFAAGLKLVRTVGIAVGTALKNIGTILGGVAAALVQLVSGNFREAGSTMTEVMRDVASNSYEAAQDISDAWATSSREIVEQSKVFSVNVSGALDTVKERYRQSKDGFASIIPPLKKGADAAKRAAAKVRDLAQALRDSKLATDALVARSLGDVVGEMRIQLQQEINAIDDMLAEGTLSAEDYARRREALEKLTEQQITKYHADEAAKRAQIRKDALREMEAEKREAERIGFGIAEAFTQGFRSVFESRSFKDIMRSLLGTFARIASFIPGGQTVSMGAGLFAGMFAEGGEVKGPGTGTSDSILARLSDGEFVMTASAVRRFGVDFFDRLNEGFLDVSALPRYAGGGMVGATATATPAPVVQQAPVIYMQAFDPRSTADAMRDIWEPVQYRRGMSRQSGKMMAAYRRGILPPRSGR